MRIFRSFVPFVLAFSLSPLTASAQNVQDTAAAKQQLKQQAKAEKSQAKADKAERKALNTKQQKKADKAQDKANKQAAALPPAQ